MRRFALIDGLKILAAQSIVIHHFSNYGPISDALEAFNLELSDGLYEYGRMAVQIFLVIGGFLAARSLAPAGRYIAGNPWRKIGQRYRRLTPPFMVAVLLACAAAAIVRSGMPYQFIPRPPEAGQLLAHALLIHSLSGSEALTAGAWYVALDFQLYAVLVLILWVAHRLQPHNLDRLMAVAAIGGLSALSVFVFNRDTGLDHLPWYFFYAYGAGVLAYWIGNAKNMARNVFALASVGAAGLIVDFRGRLLLALLTTLALITMQHHLNSARAKPVPAQGESLRRTFTAWADSSYALFLVHFSVLMLANFAWQQSEQVRTFGLGWTVAGYWLASMGLAMLFERYVERPLAMRR